MAPPIKHKTAAAKLEAMRAKCSRYYAKCRDMILAKRREKYHANKNSEEDKDGSDDEHMNDHSDNQQESLKTLADCIAVVKYAKDDFMQHVRSPRTFTLGVFAEYTKSIPDTPSLPGVMEIEKFSSMPCRASRTSSTGLLEGKMVSFSCAGFVMSGALQTKFAGA
ncbi:hypothetical protein F4604DRAFT_1936755 [Suillus subluteus]|nr:hypothetical protein F4604DRAFT_1936755 [Suillus subluteus]